MLYCNIYIHCLYRRNLRHKTSLKYYIRYNAFINTTCDISPSIDVWYRIRTTWSILKRMSIWCRKPPSIWLFVQQVVYQRALPITGSLQGAINTTDSVSISWCNDVPMMQYCLVHRSLAHLPWTIWPPFCRWHFEMYFLEWKWMNFS